MKSGSEVCNDATEKAGKGSYSHTDCSWLWLAGTLLRSLTFPADIHSVTTDPGDHALYAGAGDGRIFETSLVGEVANGEASNERHEAGYYTLEGHVAAVTCLAMTTDAQQLLSGEYALHGQCFRL